MEGLDALFNPSSVAVVGASGTPGKVGHDIFVNILKGGYTGTPLPGKPQGQVNRQRARLCGYSGDPGPH